MNKYEAALIAYGEKAMSFSIDNILDFRRESRQRSAEIARMSDAELDLEALKVARADALAQANEAAHDMSHAQQRMDRNLTRAEEFRRQIEAAKLLLGAR